MNKTRFQLPPRTSTAAGMDPWATTADTVTQAAPGEPAEIFRWVKVPFMLDMAALLAAQRRNVEALTAANRVVRQGAQAVVRRNVEIMQQIAEGVSESLQTIASLDCPAQRAIRQTEAAIKACEDATANVQELRDIVQHTRTDAMEVLNRRFAEAAEEAKSLTRCTVRDFWDNGSKPAAFWQIS
jgi:phasin family protein